MQSIGGGGGQVSLDSDGTQNPSIAHASLGGAAKGAGGAVSFTVAGGVNSRGTDAVGVLAQSIGGGGGFIDAAGTSLTGPLSLGSATGGSGNGAAVGINLNAAIVTTGSGARMACWRKASAPAAVCSCRRRRAVRPMP